MRIITRLFISILLICPPMVALAAGDSPWENKFQQTLPAAQYGKVKALPAGEEISKRDMSSDEILNTRWRDIAERPFKDTKKSSMHWEWPISEAKSLTRIFNKPTAAFKKLRINIMPEPDIIWVNFSKPMEG